MSNALSPVKSQTLADTCYERIKAAILSLDLLPNAPLDEAEIAKQLGVSKTPVREALARLTGEGLVVVSDRRSYVAELSVDLIREVFQVRIMLETASLHEVAGNLDTEALERIERSVEETKVALANDDLPGFLNSAGKFHRTLIEQSGNRFLVGLAARLFDQSRRTTAAIFRLEQSDKAHTMSKHGVAMHQEIVAALVVGDGDKAAALLRQDIESMLAGTIAAGLSGSIAKLNQGGRRSTDGKDADNQQP